MGDTYFSQIQRDEVPYDNPIVFESDEFVSTKKYENLMEVNFIDKPWYIWAVVIGNLDTFIHDEHFIDLARRMVGDKASYKETKNKFKKYIYNQESPYMNIDQFGKYMKLIIFEDGSLGINGFNKGSAQYILSDELYYPLRAYIYKYILECTKVIDKREIKDPQTLIPTFKENTGGDHYIVDPRVIYNDNDNVLSTHTKHLEYRESHIRLLHERMVPGMKARANAKKMEQPLYAYVHKKGDDVYLDEPLHTVRIDNIADDYSSFIDLIVQLKADYNTATEVIRFQTFIKEFRATDDTERKTKVLRVNDEVETVT